MKVIAIDDKKINHLRLVLLDSGVFQVQKCNPIWKTISEHEDIGDAMSVFLQNTKVETISRKAEK